MINTLIVDDEILLRKGLIALIDWKALGFQITGEASNGLEANEFIENNAVDLVISDIRMPIVSGIDLMRSVRERQKDIKFIILSGYDDFSYAQNALKYGAVSYVLKPFEEEEMVAELQKVKNDIEQSAREERKRTELEATAVDVFLSMLLNNKVDKVSFESNLSRLPIKFSGEEYQVMVLELNLTGILDKPAASPLIQRLTGILKSNYQGEALLIPDYNKPVYEIVYILNGRSCIGSANNIVRDLQALLKNSGITKYSIGIGSGVEGFEKVSQSYRNAKEALDFKISYGNKSVIYYTDIHESRNSSCHYPVELEFKIFEALRLKTSQKIELYIDDFFKHIKNSATNIKTIRQAVFKLISFCKHQPGTEYCNFDLSEIIPLITGYNDIDIIKEYVRHIFLDELSETGNESCNKRKKLIDDVKKYVGLHYSERITLEEISKTFFISKSYFCHVFKEHTGMNFYNYLNDFRIEKAKSLLKNTYYKNYEISEMIGFENSSYFNQLFKKVTGMTPCEYRDAEPCDANPPS
ncbi:two-component system response regulator YesN [Anaerobacterium chartisolvens]|uniref:Stage 0 sporulation protein A homolog n=1 Tax=Anaerobacterium chartisolvens TaxID=1297424 RepID=A0A369B7X9_9FIRM|nr:response regulator [Anaerobacterium chartisolvens]RCX17531.1 two-component system response regulator YesN [Anaerobacterium chartisolvens]